MLDIMIQNLGNAEGKVTRSTVTLQGDADSLIGLAHALEEAATGPPVHHITQSLSGIEVRFIVDRVGPALKGN